MNKIKLAIIFGGQSSEYPVSLHSAGSLIHQIHSDRYDLTYIGISKEGKWYVYEGDVEGIEHDTWLSHPSCTPCVLSCSTLHKGIIKLHDHKAYETQHIDCIFPVLHGKNGEDGTIQGLFELSGIPYVGCGHMSSSICMDKEMTHIILDHAKVPCAPYIAVYEDVEIDVKSLYEEAKEALGLPIFVKPCNAGSSFGISKINGFEGFEKALKDAFYHDGHGKLVLEQAIAGFEIGCAVLGDRGDVFAGSVDEIETSAPFFDYEGKYEMVDSHIYCPARIDDALFQKARTMAKEAYRALNCKGMTRVDMFVTPQHTIVLNEVNTIPGFTATSRYPSMMKAAGIEFPDLIDRLIALALEK